MDLFWRIGGFYSHGQYKICQHLPLTNRTLRHQPRALGIMAIYRYLTRANPDDNSGLPSVVTSLSSREVERVNRTVKLAMEREAEATCTTATRRQREQRLENINTLDYPVSSRQIKIRQYVFSEEIAKINLRQYFMLYGSRCTVTCT